jgi:hypothetical protein
LEHNRQRIEVPHVDQGHFAAITVLSIVNQPVHGMARIMRQTLIDVQK